MGSKVRLPMPQTSVTVSVDLSECLLPTAKSGRVNRVQLGAKKTTTEFVRVALYRVTGSPTSGSGGSTSTPVPASTLVGSTGVTHEIFNTTKLTGGTQTLVDEWMWNLATALDAVPNEGEPVEAEGATRFVLRLEDAPAASTPIGGQIHLELFG